MNAVLVWPRRQVDVDTMVEACMEQAATVHVILEEHSRDARPRSGTDVHVVEQVDATAQTGEEVGNEHPSGVRGG
eukprot:1027168-Heterocapsa_arctica.AAC.1